MDQEQGRSSQTTSWWSCCHCSNPEERNRKDSKERFTSTCGKGTCAGEIVRCYIILQESVRRPYRHKYASPHFLRDFYALIIRNKLSQRMLSRLARTGKSSAKRLYFEL